MKNKVLFWVYVGIIMFAEYWFSYWVYEKHIERGFVVSFRMAVPTDFLTFPITLLFISSVITVGTIGVFRNQSDEVETLPQYFLSFVRHPLPLGSILVFILAFFVL
jgi:hypothetical protein